MIIQFASLVYAFILLFLIIIGNKKNIRWLFPILFLTYPNAADNFLPGYYLNYSYLAMSTEASPFSLIDIFFLIILIKLNMIKKIPSNILLIILIVFISGTIAQVIGYHRYFFSIVFLFFLLIRLILFISILLSLYSNQKEIELMLVGVIISTFLISFESLIYTYLNNLDRLTSGNLANNSLGQFLSVATIITLYFYIYQKKSFELYFKKTGLFIIVFMIIFTILTGTRMAIILIFIGFLPIIFSKYNRIKAIIFLLLGISSLYLIIQNNEVLSRLNIFSYYDKIILSKMELNEYTSPILSRFFMWEVTYEMFVKNWFLGVGYMAWDFSRWDFGVNYLVRIDPHNAYMSILVEFGVLIFIIILYLLIKLIKIIIIKYKYNDYKGIVISVILILIGQITNNSFIKLQYLLFFISLVIILYIKNINYNN